MSDGLVTAGAFTAVSGVLAWLVKAVILEYHKRLDRHDAFMDGLVEKNNDVLRAISQRQAESAAALERVTEAVNNNTEIARCCEEVVSAQMRRRTGVSTPGGASAQD
jgi:hypothetical protein